MRTKNLLKLALTMVAMLTITGAMAQISADYQQVTVEVLGTTNISYVTSGKAMPFYEQPDSYYHPDYSADGSLTPGFTWTWTISGAATKQGESANYVEILIPTGLTAETDYTLSVNVTAPSTHGGCSGTAVTTTVRGVPAPEMGAVNYPYFNTTLGLSDGETYSVCGDMAAADVNVQLTGYPRFELKWTLTRVQIDEEGNNVGVVSTIVDNSTGQALTGTNSLTRVTNTNYLLHNYAHVMLDDGGSPAVPYRTKYVYTLGGISDLISRKSDYLGTKTWYADTNQVYTIIVNPTPKTGPIFHIPNNWGAL